MIQIRYVAKFWRMNLYFYSFRITYNITESITWITPLVAKIFARITWVEVVGPLIWIPPLWCLINSIVSPPKVSTGPVATSWALTLAPTTCLRTISLACKISNEIWWICSGLFHDIYSFMNSRFDWFKKKSVLITMYLSKLD